MRRFLVVIEQTDTGFSAYSPDLTGCIATGHTREETKIRMREVMEIHIQGLLEDNFTIPDSRSSAEFMEVA